MTRPHVQWNPEPMIAKPRPWVFTAWVVGVGVYGLLLWAVEVLP